MSYDKEGSRESHPIGWHSRKVSGVSRDPAFNPAPSRTPPRAGDFLGSHQ